MVLEAIELTAGFEQGSLLVELGEHIGVLGIEPGLVICMTSTLLSLDR